MKEEVRTNKSTPSFAKLMQGYLGFLTGRGKSLSTISSYRIDLQLFERFLAEKKKNFFQLQARDFESYLYWLEREGLKMNTRRRKIITAKALVRYAVSRKKVAPSNVQFVRAPDRLERLPWIPNEQEFNQFLSQEIKSPLSLRNRLLVQVLAETGLLVAELCALRWEQWSGNSLTIEGKKPRVLKLSKDCVNHLRKWRQENKGKHFFPGFNRHGITSEKMTPRGVELFFRHLSAQTHLSVKPKTLRHYAITNWIRQGLSDHEIQIRLGVHPHYSLDAYRKLQIQ